MSFLSQLFGGGAAMSAADFVETRDARAPLIDVRTPAEFAAGHLAGAVNVDVYAPDFPSRIAAMGLPADEPVYLYCRSGNRSGTAAQVLRQMGHAGAVNVGGFEALRRAGAAVA